MPEECFVIMPIGDQDSYAPGHFGRVYEYLIRPACERAGFLPVRADQINRTEDIVVDVLRRLIDSPMALCDLSGRNPNVMYELGFRHAFNKPITIIKDSATSRVFDIQGLRDLEYDPTLRVDTIEPTLSTLAERLQNTFNAATTGRSVANSLLQLLGIAGASLPQRVELTEGTQLVLAAVQDVGTRLSQFERRISALGPDLIAGRPKASISEALNNALLVGDFHVGERVRHKLFGDGEIVARNGERGTVSIEFDDAAVGKKSIRVAYTTLERLATASAQNAAQ